MQFSHSENVRSVYIHWPFCPYRCDFCPFVALASHDSFMERYHKALLMEMDHFFSAIDGKVHLETLYIGGGTPSTYPNDLLLDMFDKLKGAFDICETVEATIEVNPGTVLENQLALWKQCGINRMSIGVQSLDDTILCSLNRRQSAEDVRSLIRIAPRYMKTVSVDLILGLPGVTVEAWRQLVAEVCSWPIQHISIYFLTVHKNTKLFFDVQQNKVLVPGDNEQIDLYHWTVAFLKREGFDRYETSNFARSGSQCRHNTMYWDRKAYKGFGLGACSFDGTKRYANSKVLLEYLELAEQKKDCSVFEEKLTREQIHMEKVMLGLRRASGVLLDDLFSDVTEAERETIKKAIRLLKEKKYIEEVEKRIVLTPDAFVVQNDIAVKLSI